ncbi:unnamed protein product [Photorhabdus laumondii subsp. laumondii TTO1]|uniref:Photorhabdus luminescens subsp. laumondii TTO1 complete genome segment 9/17 n=1 Tax=Photorhabdus laumondii subsp. laumondii (strain DSM 15139 / CIP 105565 / TT01) TaxID=243265 RepID=Q7N422_PHOLL|nr:unnamed protein product [Photorhabdus laumondii subsp. laumondii TTO1]
MILSYLFFIGVTPSSLITTTAIGNKSVRNTCPRHCRDFRISLTDNSHNHSYIQMSIGLSMNFIFPPQLEIKIPLNVCEKRKGHAMRSMECVLTAFTFTLFLLRH